MTVTQSAAKSVDSGLSLAVDVRLQVQNAAAAHSGLDYAAILERIKADGKVTEKELRDVAAALVAEVEAGTIDQAKAQGLMRGITARLAASASADDRKVINQTVADLDTLSLDGTAYKAALEAGQRIEDRGLLRKETRAAATNGTLTQKELAGLWDAAVGRDGTVNVSDVRALYNVLDSMLKAGKITQSQRDTMSATLDAALAARANAKTTAANATSYIKANVTAHALGGNPSASATWSNALDMLTFQSKAHSDTRKVGPGIVAAFTDMVQDAQRPISDTTARAVAGVLDKAVKEGTITKADARAIAGSLDTRIAHERYGIAARSDFSVVAAATTILGPAHGADDDDDVLRVDAHTQETSLRTAPVVAS